MDKYKFKCQACGNEFYVDSEYMIKKESLVCPNCSNTLSEKAFNHLKNAAISLEEYRKCGMDDNLSPNHFELTIQ